jgi:hypothetical protein
MAADGANLKLDNQKNGHKGYVCTMRQMKMTSTARHAMPMIPAHQKCHAGSVDDRAVSSAVKEAATTLGYPENKSIPIQRVDTHSLWGGGANALSLNGYSNTQIQKMGRWTGDSFKEYIRIELAEFSMGMSHAMKKSLGYMVVLGGAFHALPEDLVNLSIRL